MGRTMQAYKHLAKEFLSYLDDNNLRKDSMSKEELKSIFNTQYRPQKLPHSPAAKMPTFNNVSFALVRFKFAKRNEGMMTFDVDKDTVGQGGGQGRTRNQTRKRNQRTKHDGALEEVSNQSHTARRRPRRLAVDQHMTVRGELDLMLQELPVTDRGGAATLPARAGEAADLPAGVQKTGKFLECIYCRAKCLSPGHLKLHFASKRHRVQVLLSNFRANKGNLIKDKKEVKITSEHDAPEGRVTFEVEECVPRTVELTVENCSKNELLMFHHCEMLHRVRVFQLDDPGKVTEGRNAQTIAPGENYKIKVTANARYIGSYATTVAFTFTRENDPLQNIHIVRNLYARCHNQLVMELRPKTPYRHPPRVNVSKANVETIDGLPLPRETHAELEKEIEIERYNIPGNLRKALNHGLKARADMSNEDKKNIKEHVALLKANLNASNHFCKFSQLLHIEETQMEVDIRRYDLQGVTLRTCRDNSHLLELKVPGLAENRPSVLRDDALHVRPLTASGAPENKEYTGYVHQVGISTVRLGFSRKLLELHVSNMKFNVRFDFNRMPLRLEHRAVQLAEEHSLHTLLFPTPQTICTRGTIQDVDAPLRFYNRKLESNAEQTAAVRHIVAGTSRPAPYLVFGPPGTGKTVTIVEAMKQVIKCIPTACILACAPSNSAADLVTSRLLDHLSRREVVRLNAFSRNFDTIPENIRDACNYDKGMKDFFFPKKAELMKYRVVVTTLVTAGRIASANFPPGHFSHVFLDESGHAMEPEAVIAIAGILDSDISQKDGGQVVLAGDPEQLGPVLRSPVAIQYGLATSLLERYMKGVDVYKRVDVAAGSAEALREPGQHGGATNQAYDQRLLTKLVRNYRSHPAILKLPNECFYHEELQTFVDEILCNSLCGFEGLVTTDFPVIFHGVVGKDEREERSPSFFNPEEVSVVKSYVEDLLSARGIKVQQKEIGIISPYRKQVQKIQQVMRKLDLCGLHVGSVEEFQGQERRVIIISTVRSNPDFLSMDAEFKLGFLKNPKRFNVAITRAQALLIVIGNPHLLSKDPYWNKFLQYCRANKAYRGCDYEEMDDNQLDDIIQRFTAVQLNELESTPGGQVSQVEYQEQPEWRRDT